LNKDDQKISSVTIRHHSDIHQLSRTEGPEYIIEFPAALASFHGSVCFWKSLFTI